MIDEQRCGLPGDRVRQYAECRQRLVMRKFTSQFFQRRSDSTGVKLIDRADNIVAQHDLTTVVEYIELHRPRTNIDGLFFLKTAHSTVRRAFSISCSPILTSSPTSALRRPLKWKGAGFPLLDGHA